MAPSAVPGRFGLTRASAYAESLAVNLGADGERPWTTFEKGSCMGSVIKKRRKRMSKKKYRKRLKATRVQRRKLGK
jgi:hypothetical protein